MPTTSEKLSQLGVTFEQAREFIVSNVTTPQVIFDVSQQYGITNAMLAEIYGGVTDRQVEVFFAMSGIDSTPLDAPPETGGTINILPEEVPFFSQLFGLNDNTGVLSTEALREGVIANVGEDAYYETFDPTSYVGYNDGIFSFEDHGVSGLGDVPATAEALESLYYGTFINLWQSVDLEEFFTLDSFTTDNHNALANKEQPVYGEYLALLEDTVSDSTNPPVFTDEVLAFSLEVLTEARVELVGDSQSIFADLETVFL